MNYLCFYKGLLLDETTDLDDIVESLGKLKKGLIEDPRPYIKLQEIDMCSKVYRFCLQDFQYWMFPI